MGRVDRVEGQAPESQIDVRAARFELLAMAVVLLGAFVFQQVWAAPALAAVLAVGLGLGRRANLLHQLFLVLIADRLKPATGFEPESAVRFSELFAVVLLTLASLLFFVGVRPIGWLLVLIDAGVCALNATTGISVERAVRERWFRR
jgi:Domain of unknown function (DUF4395)